MILGLTGGIATGKTMVSDLFKEMGFDVIDTDIISREVIELPDTIYMLVKEFGDSILDNNNINRTKLREVVFSDKNKVKKLNAIMHPTIIKITEERIKELKSLNKPLIIVVIPLLFETSLEYLVDKVLLISATRETQIERIMKRDKSNRADAENIINSQMSLKEKKEKSQYIIENNGHLSELKQKVIHFLKNLNYTGEHI